MGRVVLRHSLSCLRKYNRDVVLDMLVHTVMKYTEYTVYSHDHVSVSKEASVVEEEFASTYTFSLYL